MRISLACLLALCALPAGVMAAGRVGTRQTGSARQHYRQPAPGP